MTDAKRLGGRIIVTDDAYDGENVLVSYDPQTSPPPAERRAQRKSQKAAKKGKISRKTRPWSRFFCAFFAQSVDIPDGMVYNIRDR